MSRWIDDKIAASAKCHPSFMRGRTFVGCKSKQGEMVEEVRRTTLKAEVARGLEVARRATAQHERVLEEEAAETMAQKRGPLCGSVCLRCENLLVCHIKCPYLFVQLCCDKTQE